jgi:hypothetical protein
MGIGIAHMNENTMRNLDAKHIDFNAFEGLLWNPKALPSNIDMIIERNGHFLIGEWKQQYEDLSKGQEILLKALAKEKNKVVLLINGSTDNGITIVQDFYRICSDGEIKRRGRGLNNLLDLYRRWGRWANEQ